ncbi:MAG: extracellular solute-binding protein [Sphaerochaetaceae bacterium]|nr:extracellular solute-binding protein [Sphaerochaetaceae bacterium]
MKKFLTVILALAMVSALFAGGASEQKEDIVLTFWTSTAEAVDWYTNVVTPAFKVKHPEVKDVEITFTSIEDFNKKLPIVIPSGEAPDLMEMEDSWAPQFITAGYISPNSDRLNNVVAKLKPSLQMAIEHNGKKYGVPAMLIHEFMYYNKTMFDAAGIKEFPNTMDELLEVAQKLTKRDAAGNVDISGFSMRLGGNPNGTFQKFWVLALLSNGVEMVEESKTTPGKFHCGFDNEAGYNALKLYSDMLYGYKVDDFNSMKDSEAFAAGKTAINMRESQSIQTILELGPNLDWRSAPMPIGKSGKRATFEIALNLYVPASTKEVNKPYAESFIETALEQKVQEEMVRKAFCLSPLAGFNHVGLIDPRAEVGYTFPDDMVVYSVPIHNAYDAAATRVGNALPSIFKDASLYNNPEGIRKQVSYLAKLVNDAYKEYGEYAE